MSEVRYNSEQACDECGRFGAHSLGDEWLCLDCYEGRGSCCAERTLLVDEDRCGAGRDRSEVGAAAETALRDDGAAAQDHPVDVAIPRTGGMAKARLHSTCASPPFNETHRVNANCCYEACPGCSSLKSLREFRSRHPVDWHRRLNGLPRIVAKARARV